ncbi:MAG: hypothetical protein JSU59_06665 [Nitrospirota bacterium]|nr:MAG: hypothetical protein JSU59_06665 [Nitrospirota bacterium]
MELRENCTNELIVQGVKRIRTLVVVTGVLWILGWASLLWAAQPAPHKIIFDNQSGQNALVKLIGSTKLVVKVPKQRKKTVHAAEGDYYILVRYGDSIKDFTYTKSDPFAVTQSGDQYSIITFTLYRTRGGDFNVTPVSPEEFEKAGLSAKDPSP